MLINGTNLDEKLAILFNPLKIINIVKIDTNKDIIIGSMEYIFVTDFTIALD
jgi:hypothetical protein